MFDDLSDLKAGDEVIYYWDNPWSPPKLRVVKIDKVTPKGAIRIGDELFDRSGRRKGKFAYRSPYLRRITPELRHDAEHENLILKIRSKVQFEKLTFEQLRQIWEILQ